MSVVENIVQSHLLTSLEPNGSTTDDPQQPHHRVPRVHSPPAAQNYHPPATASTGAAHARSSSSHPGAGATRTTTSTLEGSPRQFHPSDQYWPEMSRVDRPNSPRSDLSSPANVITPQGLEPVAPSDWMSPSANAPSVPGPTPAPAPTKPSPPIISTRASRFVRKLSLHQPQLSPISEPESLLERPTGDPQAHNHHHHQLGPSKPSTTQMNSSLVVHDDEATVGQAYTPPPPPPPPPLPPTPPPRPSAPVPGHQSCVSTYAGVPVANGSSSHQQVWPAGNGQQQQQQQQQQRHHLHRSTFGLGASEAFRRSKSLHTTLRDPMLAATPFHQPLYFASTSKSDLSPAAGPDTRNDDVIESHVPPTTVSTVARPLIGDTARHPAAAVASEELPPETVVLPCSSSCTPIATPAPSRRRSMMQRVLAALRSEDPSATSFIPPPPSTSPSSSSSSSSSSPSPSPAPAVLGIPAPAPLTPPQSTTPTPPQAQAAHSSLSSKQEHVLAGATFCETNAQSEAGPLAAAPVSTQASVSTSTPAPAPALPLSPSPFEPSNSRDYSPDSYTEHKLKSVAATPGTSGGGGGGRRTRRRAGCWLSLCEAQDEPRHDDGSHGRGGGCLATIWHRHKRTCIIVVVVLVLVLVAAVVLAIKFMQQQQQQQEASQVFLDDGDPALQDGDLALQDGDLALQDEHGWPE